MLQDVFEALKDFLVDCGKLAQIKRAEGQLKIERKEDQSWVSNVDLKLNDLICEKLQRLFPQDEIISEEGFSKREKPQAEKAQWYVDPIDGTSGYIKNIADWALQIGRVQNGKIQMGIVYQPDENKFFYGAPQESSFLEHNGKRKKLNINDYPLKKEIQEFCYPVSPHYDQSHIYEHLKKFGIVKIFKKGSLGLKVLTLAEGRADLYSNIGSKTMYWDLVPPAAILLGAGGVLKSFHQKELQFSSATARVDQRYYCCREEYVEKLQALFQEFKS